MNERWTWVIRYVVVIVLALILAAVFGDMALFKTTKLGKSGLSAARVVEFCGYGGALLVFWLTAYRAALQLPSADKRWDLIKNIIVPLATLIVVACGQATLLLLVGPLMGKAAQTAYNWIAIAAIIASAGWLLTALFTGSSSLAPLFANAKRGRQREQSSSLGR